VGEIVMASTPRDGYMRRLIALQACASVLALLQIGCAEHKAPGKAPAAENAPPKAPAPVRVVTRADMHREQGCKFINAKEFDRAIAEFNQAIRHNAGDAMAYYFRGGCYEKKGDYDKAIADFNEAIRLDPLNAQAYNHRGFAYQAKGDKDAAIADYNE